MFSVASGFDNWCESRSRPEVNQLIHWVIHKQYMYSCQISSECVLNSLSYVCDSHECIVIGGGTNLELWLFHDSFETFGAVFFVRSVIKPTVKRGDNAECWIHNELQRGLKMVFRKRVKAPAVTPLPLSTHAGPPTHPHTTGLCRKTIAAYLL